MECEILIRNVILDTITDLTRAQVFLNIHDMPSVREGPADLSKAKSLQILHSLALSPSYMDFKQS